MTPPFRRLTGDASLGGNVLGGILTDLPIGTYLEESGVPLDAEQRGVLEAINKSENALHIVSALAGAGKTVLAHCIIKCFIFEVDGSDPRRLVLYTVPTRTLRDEVVADLLKFKLLLLNYELVIEFSMLLFFPIILNWYACPGGRAQRIDLVWPPAR